MISNLCLTLFVDSPLTCAAIALCGYQDDQGDAMTNQWLCNIHMHVPEWESRYVTKVVVAGYTWIWHIEKVLFREWYKFCEME